MARTALATGSIIGLIIVAVVGALVGYDLAGDIFSEAEDYNTTLVHGCSPYNNDTGACTGGTPQTSGKMAELFAGTIFIIGLGIAIVKGFGII